MTNNPFHILDLTPTATAEQIRARHRRLALRLHPDLVRGKRQTAEGAIEMAQINAARDLLIEKKTGKLTPLAKQLRRQFERGAGATVHHTRHTFYQGGQQVGSVDVIYAEATNAAMRELLEQLATGEPVDVGAIVGAGLRRIVPKKKRGRN
jgi:DnaJ-class molecular chaperone